MEMILLSDIDNTNKSFEDNKQLFYNITQIINRNGDDISERVR